MRIAAVLASAVFSATAASASLATNGAWTQSTNAQTANVLAIAIDPVRPSTLYAATYKDGVYKSTDGGRNWRGVGVGQGVRSLAIDPVTSSTVYAGTWRRGIFKTTDGGTTWSFLKLPHNDMGVLALVVDPKNPETVYAGTESLGIVKTTDGGVTWSEMNRGIGRRMVNGLAIDPTSPDTVYAATFREGYQEGSGSVFKTTNGAVSWSEIKREKLASGEASPSTRGSPRRSTPCSTLVSSGAPTRGRRGRRPRPSQRAGTHRHRGSADVDGVCRAVG